MRVPDASLPPDRSDETSIDAARSASPDQNDAGSAAEVPLKPPTGYVTPAAEGDLHIELGVPDATGLEFTPLKEGGPIPIAGLGQVGLTARLALRVRGDAVDAATIRIELTNLYDENRDAGVNNNADIPQPLECKDDGFCYAVIQRVEISHLNRLPELEGTVVGVGVWVHSPAPDLGGAAHSWGYFYNDN